MARGGLRGRGSLTRAWNSTCMSRASCRFAILTADCVFGLSLGRGYPRARCWAGKLFEGWLLGGDWQTVEDGERRLTHALPLPLPAAGQLSDRHAGQLPSLSKRRPRVKNTPRWRKSHV